MGFHLDDINLPINTRYLFCKGTTIGTGLRSQHLYLSFIMQLHSCNSAWQFSEQCSTNTVQCLIFPHSTHLGEGWEDIKMVQSCSFVLLSVRTINLMHIRILRGIPTAENEGLPCLNPRCPTCQNSSICSFFIEKKPTRCINVTRVPHQKTLASKTSYLSNGWEISYL